MFEGGIGESTMEMAMLTNRAKAAHQLTLSIVNDVYPAAIIAGVET